MALNCLFIRSPHLRHPNTSASFRSLFHHLHLEQDDDEPRAPKVRGFAAHKANAKPYKPAHHHTVILGLAAVSPAEPLGGKAVSNAGWFIAGIVARYFAGL